MIKLIYRGVNYQSQPQKLYSFTSSDQDDANKTGNFEHLVLIQPMHYYTYRGVSYTKTVVADR